MISTRILNINSIKTFQPLIRTLSGNPQITKAIFQDGINNITMCDSKTRNALSIQMMKQLIDNIKEHEENKDLRAIVIQSTGPVFSAGHNLKELTEESGKAQHEEVFSLSSILMNVITNSPVPVIAKVNGLAAAAGCQLVAHCDISICTENSTFSTPGANFGIFCSTPGVVLARNVRRKTALHMLLTGLPITSFEAKESGLITKVCKESDLEKETGIITEAIKAKSRSVVELGKKFYYKQVQVDFKMAYDQGAQVMVNNLSMKDGREGIKSFVEKRKAKWSH